MKSTRRFDLIYRSFSAVLAPALYVLAFLVMESTAGEYGLGRREIHQMAVTFLGMGLASTAFHIRRSILIQTVALLIQFLGALFLSVLVGRYPWIALLWVLPLLVQFGLIMDLMSLLPFSILLIASQTGEPGTLVAWGQTVPPSHARDRLTVVGVSLAAVLVVAGVRYLYDRLLEQERLVENLKTNILKLTRANYDFQRYAADTEELTLKKERLRISREIHDTVGYTMTTLRMMLEASTDLITKSPLKLEVQLRKALDLMNQGHRDIRLALSELRERESDRPRGLRGLKALIDLFSETTGVRVNTEWGNLPWFFPDSVEAAIFRFVQEGLSNALSHGNATEIDLHFRAERDDIVMILSDDGAGADVLIEGLGLLGMRERIEERGGVFEARNTREGFLLQARLPFKETLNAEDSPAHR